MTLNLPAYLQRASIEYKLQKARELSAPLMQQNIADWIESHFYLYDTAQRMTLLDCQRRPLQKALERDEHGKLKYRTIVWSWPKKSAKSSVIAAVADYLCEHTPRAQVKLIGNDLKQADSRVGFYLRESIRLGQKAGQRSRDIKITPSGYRVEYPNGSKVEMLPIDPTGEAGGNDDMIVYSELWGWKSTAHLRMWEEMTLSPNKPDSQRYIDTYAGFIGGSPLLEPLYEVGVKQGYRVWEDLEVYANDAAKVLAVWVTKPMFSWQTADYYAEQAATLTPDAFDRMHKNQWVSETNAFIPMAWWHACKGELPEVGKYEQWVIGLDAAVSDDSFGMTAYAKVGNQYVVRYANAWTPPKGGKINFDDPKAELIKLIESGRVACIVYDRYELHYLMSEIDSKYNVWIQDFSQGAQRLVADKLLYDLIRDKRIVHSGEAILEEHLGNANAEIKQDKLRIVKRSQELKIDTAVCSAMAVYQLEQLNL